MKEVEKIPQICGILVAAGNGQRMLGVSKQLYEINGRPVIAHTIEAFLDCPQISQLILVSRENEFEIMTKIASRYIGEKLPYKVVRGADTRQSSVFCGVKASAAGTDYYAIHDGVRPLVKPSEIEQCIKLAEKTGAATLGVRVKDTIKVVGDGSEIKSTPNREELYAIQTPQVFEAELYNKAVEKAVCENKNYTDDCQLIENIGKTVTVCEGSYENIKITTREDVYIVKAVLDYRKNGI